MKSLRYRNSRAETGSSYNESLKAELKALKVLQRANHSLFKEIKDVLSHQEAVLENTMSLVALLVEQLPAREDSVFSSEEREKVLNFFKK
jgi:hypothetical protein